MSQKQSMSFLVTSPSGTNCPAAVRILSGALLALAMVIGSAKVLRSPLPVLEEELLNERLLAEQRGPDVLGERMVVPPNGPDWVFLECRENGPKAKGPSLASMPAGNRSDCAKRQAVHSAGATL